jgi:hypothetical protein
LTTHALQTHGEAHGPGMGLFLVRYLDLVMLAAALPLFLLAGLPMLGYTVAAAAWLVQRGINHLAQSRANASDDPRTVVGLLAGSMIGRGWLTAGSIMAVGLAAEREDGLAAAILCIALFSIYFPMQIITRSMNEPKAGP